MRPSTSCEVAIRIVFSCLAAWVPDFVSGVVDRRLSVEGMIKFHWWDFGKLQVDKAHISSGSNVTLTPLGRSYLSPISGATTARSALGLGIGTTSGATSSGSGAIRGGGRCRWRSYVGGGGAIVAASGVGGAGASAQATAAAQAATLLTRAARFIDHRLSILRTNQLERRAACSGWYIYIAYTLFGSMVFTTPIESAAHGWNDTTKNHAVL